jgi:hypothetical protein
VLARPKFASDFTGEQALTLIQGLAPARNWSPTPSTPRPPREIPMTTISSRWHESESRRLGHR